MTNLTLIKLARMYQRFTLDEIEACVGKKVGLSKHVFTRIENGSYAADGRTQKVLCEFLKIKRSAAFGPNRKARLIRWKHLSKIQKMLDRG